MVFTWMLVGAVLSHGWTQSAPKAQGPIARAHHDVVYDAANQRVLIIGGSALAAGDQSPPFFQDLWGLGGSGWRALGDTGSPRAGQAVAYDSRRGRVMAYGGMCLCHPDNGGRYGDLLELRDGRWVQVGGADRPAFESRMVYDSRRGRLVRFGGLDTQAIGDTTEFDGQSWITVDGPGPAARMLHAMAFDERRGRTVLFGGSVPRAGRLADTWEYDGTAWTRRDVSGPPAMAGAGMAYDSKRGLSILFGGGMPETWAWDGTRWVVVAKDGPPPRTLTKLAYDVARDRIVMFGGRTAAGDFGDTWEWDGRSWSEVR
jgi:hypothetical protein